MPSSPGVPTGVAPPAVVYARLWEYHPVKEVGAMGGDAQELSPRLPWEDDSEAKTLEHEEKVNKYQAVLVAYLNAKYCASKAFDKGIEAKTLEHEEKVNKYQAMLTARLKAKYFFSKAFDKGDVFEEITIQSETIQFSRWPVTSLFADPAKFYQEKNMCPSLVAASSAKCNR